MNLRSAICVGDEEVRYRPDLSYPTAEGSAEVQVHWRALGYQCGAHMLLRVAVDVRHLRVFLSVAEHRSFTRAATELHLTQSAVSRTLRQLEDQVGRVLLDRSTHHVALTVDGQAFRESAAALLADFETLIAPPPDSSSALRVGHSWSALGPLTGKVLDQWRQLHPQVLLELQRWDDRYAGLLEGRVDIAILRGADPAPGIVMQPLFREQRVAAVASGHPLARRTGLTFADLSGAPLVSNVISGATKPSWWPEGLHPAERIRVTNMDDWALRISSGQGFGIASESMRYMYPYPGLVYLPLLDGPPVQVDLAWKHHVTHPLVPDFVRMVEEILEATRGADG